MAPLPTARNPGAVVRVFAARTRVRSAIPTASRGSPSQPLPQAEPLLARRVLLRVIARDGLLRIAKVCFCRVPRLSYYVPLLFGAVGPASRPCGF